MKAVLVIAALPLELRWIPPRPDIFWIKTAFGPGSDLAGQAADAADPGADTVISAGLCGAVDPTLRLGDIVIGTAVNGIPVPSLPAMQGFHSIAGPVASLNYVADAATKRELRASGAVAVEMEAAAVLERANRWGKPFYCVKAVSDTADDDFRLDLNAARDRSGRFKVGNLLAQAARRPFAGFPELWKLKKNSETAAKALGGFLAHCQL